MRQEQNLLREEPSRQQGAEQRLEEEDLAAFLLAGAGLKALVGDQAAGDHPHEGGEAPRGERLSLGAGRQSTVGLARFRQGRR